MDDILVHGKNKNEHDQQLKETLQRLEKAGITLNREKCEFSRNTVKFLGHIIDANGLHPDPDKVKAVTSMSEPTNITEVRRFLGIANQLSKFSPKLADLSEPLRALLKKKNMWTWSEIHRKAFCDLKNELSSEMKGDTDSLKQALRENFSENEVANALKILWDSSSSVLESSGFTYHQRRGSKKCPVAELVIKDILSAFDKLDSSESIPPMYYEASDLLKLPPIATDMPIATVQESNLRIKDLQTDVQVSNNHIRDLQANLNNLTSVFSNQATRLESLKESLNNSILQVTTSLVINFPHL